MATRKSNRGQSIDMEAMIAANKQTRAVGNMRVNAGGDLIGAGGEIVKKNEERVREYYTNNPRSSTSKQSLKGKKATLEPDAVDTAMQPKTAKTAKENVRTAEEPKVTDTVEEILKDKKSAKAKPAPAPVEEPDEFAAPEDLEPLGFKEVELPNGDIEMVPYYREEDAG
jgi:hypothetical protein